MKDARMKRVYQKLKFHNRGEKGGIENKKVKTISTVSSTAKKSPQNKQKRKPCDPKSQFIQFVVRYVLGAGAKKDQSQ